MLKSNSVVIEVKNLVVEYGRGEKGLRAVDDLSFTIESGECVGFIGANGAGKSSTIKAIMGFLKPKSGEIRIFDAHPGSVESRKNVGYLPEVAQYYPFMKARELLELYGALHGLTNRELKTRIPELLQEVGLEGKSEVFLREFSKGMQQRLGIAQALIAKPQLYILDEMSSGLDPLGRHDLRALMSRLKREGHTLFFSSHELTEVEALCDRVLMIHKGRLIHAAGIQDLVKPLHEYRVEFSGMMGELPQEIQQKCRNRPGNRIEMRTRDMGEYVEVLKRIQASQGTFHRMESEHGSLEDFFIQLVRGEVGE